MTLTKPKPRRTTTEHRKRSGHHHRHSHDYLKTYWPYLPIVAILSCGLLLNGWLGSMHRNVLGYATDMSATSLLDDTNQQRLDNHEAALALNSQLAQAAQTKANDMAARDYWSHDTPDGKTPWTFITAAGYDYQSAGENLAYGFTTAAYTVTAWMNSPEHRANILNASFQDVGFGIINIANYQNDGPETLVVAMYGQPSVPHPAAITHPATAAPISKPQTTETQPAAPAPTPSPIVTTQPASEPQPITHKADTVEPQPQRVTQLALVASNTPMNALVLSLFGLAAAGFLILRHSLAWRRVVLYGEAFALRHPFLDITAVSIASAAVVLGHTVGLIR